MPSNLSINIILNSVQTLLNAVSITVNVIPGQRNIILIIMTAIDRHFNYFIQYQFCIIVTVQYHDNEELMLLNDTRIVCYRKYFRSAIIMCFNQLCLEQNRSSRK
jgi:hypothetical protein